MTASHSWWLFLSAVLAVCPGPLRADAFPSKPVRIVVPYPLSGPTDIRGTTRATRTYRMVAYHAPPPLTDILARLVAQAIEDGGRHEAMLDRQPGGATARGAAHVARSPADGHTLLLASDATMVINPGYFSSLDYEPSRDFVPVAPLATMPFVLVTGPGVPAENAQELMRWLKPRARDINYGSSGEGSTGHLAGELLRRMAGISAVHVPYNGGLAALNGLETGQVSMMFAALPLALPYLSRGNLKVVALAGGSRHALLPGLPTLAESGVPGFDVEGWYGVFAPARTPSAATIWLNERITGVFSHPVTRSQLAGLGLEAAVAPRGQFASRIRADGEKWIPVLRASRLSLDGA